MTTASIPPDPMTGSGLAAFGARVRAGAISIEDTVPGIWSGSRASTGSSTPTNTSTATAPLQTAGALDSLLRAGVDLGPLMGVPVAVKDLFAVGGMPTTAGSQVDVADLAAREGPFIAGLRRAGAVILGKTKTVEFAFGATGTNAIRGTPWNPHDAAIPRIPGGSSSGSAVSVAAGLCAIGSDTGGSVRVPAALCGVFGLKTTVGVFDTSGVFPLSTTLDTIGLLTRSAADAALAFMVLTGRAVEPHPLAALRLGLPAQYMFDGLDPAVGAACETALRQLEAAGAKITGIEFPEAKEREGFFPIVLAVELVASLGRERFERYRGRMDPLITARIARGVRVEASDYHYVLRLS